MSWRYEKLMPDGTLRVCPQSDDDGKITGMCVFNLKAWFDENPEKAKEMGWVKHIKPEYPEYDKQTQFIMTNTVMIDENTLEDVYTVADKSEEMLLMEELLYMRNDDIMMWIGDGPLGGGWL